MVVVPETGGKFVTSSGVEKKKSSLDSVVTPRLRLVGFLPMYRGTPCSFWVTSDDTKPIFYRGHSVLVLLEVWLELIGDAMFEDRVRLSQKKLVEVPDPPCRRHLSQLLFGGEEKR